jgi:glycosyltransferase involved in cell wall biosynthesis
MVAIEQKQRNVQMRICRIIHVLPCKEHPGGGLVPYYLAKYIPEPTLYIAPKLTDTPPLPGHLQVAMLDFRDATTPACLRSAIFDPRRRLFSRLRAQILLLIRIVCSDYRFFLFAMRRMARFRPHLMICGSIKRLHYGIAAKYLFGAKLILSLHNTTETAALNNLWLLRWLIKIPDRIVVVSSEIGRQLRRFVPDKLIRVSSTGVDLEEFVNWNESRKNQLVTIGAFKWKKGYIYLLEAARLVFKRYPDYRLIIVGDGEERQEIINTIERLGLNNRVILQGIVPRQEIVRLLNESKLFVMASLHEGLPKALLEAIACGTPAVITDGCNAEGIIEQTGLIVPAGSSQALAEAIITLLKDPGLWETCSRNGPAIGRPYDWKAVAARDYSIYCELFPESYGQNEMRGNHA